ncbi:MAG: ABC transporter ATP-binding protein [Treponema sp.]|nr:ABC transporter ATP-binding protein [Treponema sp.]
METALSLENISFSYGSSTVPVIDNFSLEVEKGSFTTLLGSSGCGKTTLLRLISGFLEPSKGVIRIDGKAVNSISPENRKIAMVFQDYALFPHMTVGQNMRYGIKIKNSKLAASERKSKQQIEDLISQTVKILDLSKLIDRFPGELSGGQQQRVALGRALVLEPQILLMDEPLSSLDTNLRKSVRAELKEIQQRLKITTIYVTHDQEEALSLSDKIAVLNEGKLLQYGTSRQVYFAPQDRFTAEFAGSANFIQQDNQTFMIRPEWIVLHHNPAQNHDAAKPLIPGTVTACEFLGSHVRYSVQTEYGILYADSSSAYLEDLRSGTSVFLEFMHKKRM